MNRICEDLEEAKTEIEKLREEIKTKTVLSETLKRAHNEQLAQMQEAISKIEKQGRELSDKEDEIVATKKMYEEVKSVVKEKEILQKHLSSTNDKLRITFDERLTQWEVEKKEIVEKLEEVNLKNQEKEQELNTYKEEIRCLKSLLSTLENKCLETEKNVKGSKEAGQRESIFLKVEEESRKIEDQLKWKKEQFKHLEEAHEKLRGEYKVSEKQWDMEKSTLLDEMYKLKEGLDSQIRISEDLQNRLQMCHQALAHEESRRKVLEIQFLETKTNFDSVLSECEEAKMEIELLTGHRDKEIASVRDLLGEKEMVYKEMEYQVGRLEQENADLRRSVKEFQESQILEKGASSSLSKLQNKLKGLEKTHKDCLNNMRAKEAKWASKLEKMDEDLFNCKTELGQKLEVIKELEGNVERLDRIHRDCSENLRAREVEWASQLEKLVDDLTECKSESERKGEVIEELQIKCEGLDRTHQDCSLKFRSEEAQWTAKLDNMAEDLANCKNELEVKDEVIKELEMKFEALDRVHLDCSSKLKYDEYQWTTQLENMDDNLCKCKTELEGKDEVVKKLEIKCEALDQVNQDCSTKHRSKEAELNLQSEKLMEDLVGCKTELASKDKTIKKLRAKMEILNQLYQDSSAILKVKEAEWAQSEGLAKDLSDCRYEVVCKDDVVKRLKSELEVLKQMNEDFSAKLRAKEAECDQQLERMAEDLAESRSEMEGKDEVMKEIQMALEDSISSNIQLELQNDEKSLILIVFKSVISDINQKISEREEEISLLIKQLETKCEDMASLSTKIESLSHVKDELELDLIKVRNALNQAHEDLSENNELEFELHVWRFNAERLSANLEEFRNLRKDLEASLLGQIQVEESLKHEKANLVKAIEEKEEHIECLEHELKASQKESGNEKEKAFYKSHEERETLEQEWLSRVLEGTIVTHMNVERVFEHEREDFQRIVREKDRRIGRKQEELNKLLKAWEKIATDELAKEVEIQEKTLVIAELEGDLENLQMRLDSQQKDLLGAKKEFDAEIFSKEDEIKELKSSLRDSEIAIGKLESEKRNLFGDVNKLLLEKERMLEVIGSLSDRVSSFSVEDMKLASLWEKIVRNCANNEEELFDPSKENIDMNSPLTKKSVEATVDGRSPLRALNS